MKQRILDFLILLLFVWGCMLFGLWVIDTIIVPLSIPWISRYAMNILQVLISLDMVVVWLYVWRWLAKSIFWRALKNNQNLKDEWNKED